MLKGSSALALRCLVQRGAARTRVDPAHITYRILSTSALPTSDDHIHHHECEKMVSEGGGSTLSFSEKKVEVKAQGVSDANQPSKSEWQDSVAGVSTKGVSDANQPSKSEWQQTKDSVTDVSGRAKNKLNEVKGSTSENADEKTGLAKSVMGKVSEQAKKEANTSADMMKDIPEKVSETTQELKEVGIEAGKAVKRDASRAAEKVGIKSPS